MKRTLFQKIIEGEIEGSIVYQDTQCAAFMDIHPFNSGHVLVVPKKPAVRLRELDADETGYLFQVAYKILLAIEKSDVQCEGANIFLSDGEIAGQEVPHVHLHIVPRFKNDGIKVSFGKTPKMVDRIALNEVAKQIKLFL